MENKIKPEVKLDNWEVTRYMAQDGTVSHVLYGNALNHPDFFIGQWIRTSRVLNVDFTTRVAETLNTRYILLGHHMELDKNEDV